MRQSSKGFTLLELMVVMVLIGVILGMVGLTKGSSPARLARQEANVLIQLIETLREQAVLEGHEFGLRLERESYQVLRLQQQGWREMGKTYQLPKPLQLHFETPGRAESAIPQRDQPQLLILSSDQVTPFTLHLQAEQRSLIRFSSDGISEAALDE